MAEDSLPRRARDTRRRLDDLERTREEAHQAFIKGMGERSFLFRETAERMIAADEVDVDALMKLSEENDRATARGWEDANKRDAELLEAARDLEMVHIEASIEGTKLRFDAIKQQATFSAAAVAGVAAVTSGILPEPLRATWLLWIALGVLLLTIATSLILLYMEAYDVQLMMQRGEEPPEEAPAANIKVFLYLSALGLPVAIVVYMTFAILNLAF